jgi:hypothetical protein
MYALAFQRVMFEVILDFIYFPIWWYTFGMVRAVKWCWSVLEDGNDLLAPGIWIVNLFVPMFGQYDWQGRIISFFMRLVQIAFRGVALFGWVIVCILLFIGYLLLPPVILFGFLSSINKF